MPKDTGAKTANEMGANRHTGQVAFADSIHHAHMGAQETSIADANGGINDLSSTIVV